LLDEFERSGISGQKFAELVGIKYQTFATWAQKRRRQRGADGAVKAPRTTDRVRWLEAVVEQAQNSADQNPQVLVMELPGGARMEIRDAKQAEVAAALLRALAQPC
jgi:hypothetical protein